MFIWRRIALGRPRRAGRSGDASPASPGIWEAGKLAVYFVIRGNLSAVLYELSVSRRRGSLPFMCSPTLSILCVGGALCVPPEARTPEMGRPWVDHCGTLGAGRPGTVPGVPAGPHDPPVPLAVDRIKTNIFTRNQYLLQ